MISVHWCAFVVNPCRLQILPVEWAGLATLTSPVDDTLVSKVSSLLWAGRVFGGFFRAPCLLAHQLGILLSVEVPLAVFLHAPDIAYVALLRQHIGSWFFGEND